MVLMYITSILVFFILSIVIWILVGIKWEDVGDFFHSRYDFFDFSFILFYFIEQLILFFLIYKGYNAQITSGLFALIIITTASLQNKCWECRTKEISEVSVEQANIIDSLSEGNKKIIKDNDILKKELQKHKELNDYLFNELEKMEKRIR